MSDTRNTATLTITLGTDDEELRHDLLRIADERTQSVDALVRAALREWLTWNEDRDDALAIREALAEQPDGAPLTWAQVRAEFALTDSGDHDR
jgi:predicted transcriptional regulator